MCRNDSLKFAQRAGLIENQIDIQFLDWTARRRGFQNLPLSRRQSLQPLLLCPAFHLPSPAFAPPQRNSPSSTWIALALLFKSTDELGKVIGNRPDLLGAPEISKLATHCSNHYGASRALLSAEHGDTPDATAPQNR
jgi:hypothetical protein